MRGAPDPQHRHLPLISKFPTAATQLACSGGSALSGVAEQANDAISPVNPYDYFTATPQGTAAADVGDLGGACFSGDTLYALELSCDDGSCSLEQASDLADFVYENVGPGPFCGTWTCGIQQAGRHQATCGYCPTSAPVCNAGTCGGTTTGGGSGSSRDGGTHARVDVRAPAATPASDRVGTPPRSPELAAGRGRTS